MKNKEKKQGDAANASAVIDDQTKTQADAEKAAAEAAAAEGQQQEEQQPEEQQQEETTAEAGADAGKEDEQQEQQPASGKEDPLLASVFRDLSDEPLIEKVEEEKPAAENEPTEEEKKKAEDDAKAAEEAKKTEDAKKAKKPKRVSIIDEELPPVITPVVPEKVEEKRATVDPDAEYVATLTPEQQEEYQEAVWAAKNLGDKLKNRPKQLVEFYRNLDKTTAELLKENPERTFDDQDTDWVKFLKTKPKLDGLDQKKITKGMIQESAVEQVRREQSQELDQIKHKQREIELKPHVEAVVKEWDQGARELLADDKFSYKDAVKLLQEKGVEEAAKEYPLETMVITDKLNQGGELAREYTRFARNLQPFDANNPRHKWILDFVNNQCDYFAANGGKNRMQGGKQFLTRAEFARQAKADANGTAAKYWTLSHRQVLELLAVNTRNEIAHAIKDTEEQAKKLGLERRPRQASAQSRTEEREVTSLNPTRSTVTPSRGAANKGGKQAASRKPAGEPINVVETLRLRD